MLTDTHQGRSISLSLSARLRRSLPVPPQAGLLLASLSPWWVSGVAAISSLTRQCSWSICPRTNNGCSPSWPPGGDLARLSPDSSLGDSWVSRRPLKRIKCLHVANEEPVPAQWNCSSVESCPRDSNWGWRYTMFTAGALVFVLSVLRVTVVRLKETPKYLLGRGEDAALIESLHQIAQKYNRPCSLTIEQLERCGQVQSAHAQSGFISEALIHLRGLFSTKKLALSTLLIWFSWTLIGLAYPLFYVFLKYLNPFPCTLVNRHAG
jgi:hypothetical protein